MTSIDADEKPRPEGRIITFYSYKGGTGRSMAVANVAWILASNKQRVLVIDWDFEAPGLHRYFRPFLLDPELTATPGLIDFFVHFAEAARIQASSPNQISSGARPWFYDQADLLRYSVPLEHEFTEGVIDFVAAGQQGPSYPLRVNSFQWNDFYEKLGGGIFLEAMKAQMRKQYDYILIDSRTGLSDTSGICTVQMPDELVVCFTLNRQSIFGAAATAESADGQRRRSTGEQGLRIWPVPTRVELHEKERLEAARQLAREKFAPFLWHVPASRRVEYWGGSEVLYFPYYAYEEVLATIADAPRQTASLLDSMERLTSRLTEGKIMAMPKASPGMREGLLAKYHPVPSALATSPVQKWSPRFYLSYAKFDDSVPIVRKLGTALENRFGSNCVFWDERIPLGANWDLELEREMDKTDAVLVLIGPEWPESKGSKHEALRAINKHKAVVPLLVNGAKWTDVPVELRAFNGASLSQKTFDNDLQKVVESLAKSFSKAPTPEVFTPVDVDDPQRGRWGGLAQRAQPGRRLTARVNEGQQGWFNVQLVVESTDGSSFLGEVEFHLHPTFRPPVMHVPVVKGRAVLELKAWGASTVGAAADNGKTHLEINLAEIPDAPAMFRER